MKRVGVYGGSFDPVHVAHVALARTALAQFALDELRWLPVGLPWQKSRALAPGVHREAMVRLAIDGEPRFTLDRRELKRRGPTFTLDTVRELRVEEPDVRFVLMLGQDQFARLHTWRDWRELLAAVEFAVARRPGAPVEPPHPDVANAPHAEIALEPMDVSSSEVRRRVAAGRSIAGLVPDAVAGYIARHGLYRS